MFFCFSSLSKTHWFSYYSSLKKNSCFSRFVSRSIFEVIAACVGSFACAASFLIFFKRQLMCWSYSLGRIALRGGISVRILMFSRRAVRTSRVLLKLFRRVARRAARCCSFSALRAVWAAWLVLSDFLQPTSRVIVVFVGSHRVWWRLLRLSYDFFQARGAPSALISDYFQ